MNSSALTVPLPKKLTHALPEILWCKDTRRNRHLGWRFPIEIRALLKQFTAGRSVIHPFGGHADFGVRMDVDPNVKPDVVADAWMPPFGPGSFDVVVLDPPYPPYLNLNNKLRSQLFWTARYLAREHVVWWHTACTDRTRSHNADEPASLQFEIFRVKTPNRQIDPVKWFARGPQIRFNRWIAQPNRLPFPAEVAR